MEYTYTIRIPAENISREDAHAFQEKLVAVIHDHMLGEKVPWAMVGPAALKQGVDYFTSLPGHYHRAGAARGPSSP